MTCLLLSVLVITWFEGLQVAVEVEAPRCLRRATLKIQSPAGAVLLRRSQPGSGRQFAHSGEQRTRRMGCLQINFVLLARTAGYS